MAKTAMPPPPASNPLSTLLDEPLPPLDTHPEPKAPRKGDSTQGVVAGVIGGEPRKPVPAPVPLAAIGLQKQAAPMGTRPAVAAHPPAAATVPAPAKVPETTIIGCPTCGKPVASGFAFCGACGYRMKPSPGGSGQATVPAPAPQVPTGAVPRTMHMAAPPQKPAARGHLTLIRPDGTEGGVHPLQEGENLIGRGQGALFDADPYLSPRHAEFVLTGDGLTVRDLKSLNGVFMRIGQEERLESGDVFRIGQELLRFDIIAPPAPMEDGTEVAGTPNPGYWGRISIIVGRDVDGPAFPLFDESIVLGRERGDILFPEDGYVSGTHAQVTLRDGHVHLSDLGSSNGTFARVRGSRPVPAGSMLLMGQQLFRIQYR